MAAAFAAAVSVTSSALAAVRPDAGVLAYREPVCGSDWVPENLGHGDYFNVYNSQSGNTCINVSGWHDLAWSVTSVRPTARQWQSPNISSGWEWGRYTCNDGRSGYPSSPGSQCMRYPVQAKDDGMPLTSVTFWRPPADGDVGWDIWFNKTDAHPNQDNGTEIMIRPYNRNVAIAPRYKTVICHRLWYVEYWTAHRGGVSWNYVAYIAPRNVNSLSGLWLNQFERDAEAHGLLSKYWWLTAVDFLSEMNYGTGTGFTVSSYSLTGVR